MTVLKSMTYLLSGALLAMTATSASALHYMKADGTFGYHVSFQSLGPTLTNVGDSGQASDATLTQGALSTASTDSGVGVAGTPNPNLLNYSTDYALLAVRQESENGAQAGFTANFASLDFLTYRNDTNLSRGVVFNLSQYFENATQSASPPPSTHRGFVRQGTDFDGTFTITARYSDGHVESYQSGAPLAQKPFIIAPDQSVTFSFAAQTFGYAYAVVPEPAEWAMMLAGFAAVGIGRRRKAALA